MRSAGLAVPVRCETVTLAPAACNRWTTCCSEPQPAQALLPTASAGGAGPDSKGAPGVSPDHLITAMERRREAERLREVLRTVCLAWREEADGRQARGKAGRAGRGGERGAKWLSGRGEAWGEQHPSILKSQNTTHVSQVHGERVRGRDPYKETGTCMRPRPR